jgi:hypothetical protein
MRESERERERKKKWVCQGKKQKMAKSELRGFTANK